MGSKGYSFMLALFTCEIFSKWYREMDTICFPAVFFWQEPLRMLYGNEFCLNLMKTLLSTEEPRNWRLGINIRLVVLLIQTYDFFFFRLSVKSVLFSLCLDFLGKKSPVRKKWIRWQVFMRMLCLQIVGETRTSPSFLPGARLVSCPQLGAPWHPEALPQGKLSFQLFTCNCTLPLLF